MEPKPPKPISIKLEIYDHVRDPTPYDNFGGRSTMWVIWANRRLATFRTFLSFFLSHTYRSDFLTDLDDLLLCVKTRAPGQGCAFWGSGQKWVPFPRSTQKVLHCRSRLLSQRHTKLGVTVTVATLRTRPCRFQLLQ